MHARFSDSIPSICADEITHAEINKHQQFLALALSRPFVGKKGDRKCGRAYAITRLSCVSVSVHVNLRW